MSSQKGNINSKKQQSTSSNKVQQNQNQNRDSNNNNHSKNNLIEAQQKQPTDQLVTRQPNNVLDEDLPSEESSITQSSQKNCIQLPKYADNFMFMQAQTKSKIFVLPYLVNTSAFNYRAKSKPIQFRKQLNLIQQLHEGLQIRIIFFNMDKNEIEFKILYKSNITYDQIKQLLQEEFIQKLQFYTVDIDFTKFLQYLEIDIDDFETDYDIVVGKIYDKVTFLSTKYCLDQVTLLIQQFQLSLQPKTLSLKFDSNVLFKRLLQMIQSKQLKISQEINYHFIGTSIQLVGPDKQITAAQQLITKTEQQLKSQLIKRTLYLNQREVLFFIKKIKPNKLEQYLNQFECEILVTEEKLQLMASTLSLQGRELNIMHADISRFECDAIVNSCNNLMSFGNVGMSSGVAKNIFDMAGPCYTKFCELYIQENKTLEYGQAITYQMPSLNGLQKYIINVSTPIYKNGEQTNQDYLKIEQNVKAIFVEANKLNIATLALPIFGGGASGYSFKLIAQNVLNYIINALYSDDNKTVQKVYVTELARQKLTQICSVLKRIFEASENQIRQVKYQWQWAQGNQFKDYDDEEINMQIDEGYEQFLNQKVTLEQKLVFPFTKQPGTHLVDLQKMTITDKDLGTKIQLSLQIQTGNSKFLFNDQEIDQVLNEYLMLQKLQNNLKFEIFYKKHKIIFHSDNSIQQLNEATGFKRNVKFIPHQKNQQQINQNILIGKNAKLEENSNEQLQNQELVNAITIESFDIQVIEELQKTIKEDILKNTIDFQIQLPLIKQEDFNDLKTYIIWNSIKSYSEIENGKNLTLQIFSGKQHKIQTYIDRVIANTTRYPINWIQQDKNVLKIDLSSDSEEYKEIEAEFKKTDNGKISKVFRLQNQRLWENYQSELKKLQDISMQRNTALTLLEQERYLWHGVSKQHPKQIYESMKEAFDITYSNQGMWGIGIYFAERASYSRGYSYKLTEQDDPNHVNKLVFLCCKVATGRIHTCNSDNTLKRPPTGYDCVGGITGGSNVFILYGMDVRRAYPAYEIIYE